jgi:hypothetical protein
MPSKKCTLCSDLEKAVRQLPENTNSNCVGIYSAMGRRLP